MSQYAPPIIKTETGPKSRFDLDYIDVKGKKPRGRVVPKDRRFSSYPGITLGNIDLFEVVSPEKLHAEATDPEVKRKGRRPTLDLDAVKRVKADYWSGKLKQNEVAKELGVSLVTAAKIIHGESYWYA